MEGAPKVQRGHATCSGEDREQNRGVVKNLRPVRKVVEALGVFLELRRHITVASYYIDANTNSSSLVGRNKRLSESPNLRLRAILGLWVEVFGPEVVPQLVRVTRCEKL